MRFQRAYTLAMLFVGAAYSQGPEDKLRAAIAEVRYTPLAVQARIQGDVHLKLKSGVVSLISGTPLLARTAVESAKAIGSIQGEPDLDVTYHFVLVDADSVPTPTTVKRGNAFERAVLRMLGLKTEKVVIEFQCQEGFPPPNVVTVAGTVIEIWIYGRPGCPQTQATALLARR